MHDRTLPPAGDEDDQRLAPYADGYMSNDDRLRSEHDHQRDEEERLDGNWGQNFYNLVAAAHTAALLSSARRLDLDPPAATRTAPVAPVVDIRDARLSRPHAMFRRRRRLGAPKPGMRVGSVSYIRDAGPATLSFLPTVIDLGPDAA